MKKICPNCEHVFNGNIQLEECPIADCVNCELIEVDDMMVDVILRFWSRGVGIDYSCAGHLYKHCAKPTIVFNAACEDTVGVAFADFKALLMEVNADNETVTVGEIVDHCEHLNLQVSGSCDSGPKQRLKNQMDFFSFLYDVLARMDVLWEELAMHDDESVMETDITET